MRQRSKKQQKISLRLKEKRQGKALAKQRRGKRSLKAGYLWQN